MPSDELVVFQLQFWGHNVKVGIGVNVAFEMALFGKCEIPDRKVKVQVQLVLIRGHRYLPQV